jgi:hypothetical protein
LLEKAGTSSVPEAATAVFVGTEFDSLSGRGGNDGTPLRKTPWGEIAFQLGGEASFCAVAEHEKQFVEPKLAENYLVAVRSRPQEPGAVAHYRGILLLFP